MKNQNEINNSKWHFRGQATSRMKKYNKTTTGIYMERKIIPEHRHCLDNYYEICVGAE